MVKDALRARWDRIDYVVVKLILAEAFINDNGISGIGLAFFTALLGAVSATIVGIFQVKNKVSNAEQATVEAREEATQARKNTSAISNGFASGIDGKLDRILDQQDSLMERQNAFSAALRKHLEWHIDHSSSEGKRS